jgi:hypothetical protein
MKDALSQSVFTVAGKDYTWRDAMIAARIRGEWDPFEADILRGISRVKRANESGDPISRAEVEAAARQFRYDHNLITAQETTSWLNEWGLGLDEWNEYFHRALLRQRWPEELAEAAPASPESKADIERLILVEGVCSGRLREWAVKLAGRAAVADRLARQSPEVFDSLDKRAAEIVASRALDVKVSRAIGETGEALAQKVADLARLEAAFDHFQSGLATPKAIRERIAANYLDWIRFDISMVTFADEAAASEAALCVREDGLSLAEVAEDAQRPISHEVVYLDQAEAALKGHLLGAQKEAIVGPVKRGDGFALFWLADKQMPSEEDPQIRERAEEAILKAAVNHEINNRVLWIARL